jgi:hypothetical protein
MHHRSYYENIFTFYNALKSLWTKNFISPETVDGTLCRYGPVICQGKYVSHNNLGMTLLSLYLLWCSHNFVVVQWGKISSRGTLQAIKIAATSFHKITSCLAFTGYYVGSLTYINLM